MKSKSVFVCSACGALAPKWAGQCADCGAWNCLSESAVPQAQPSARFQGYHGEAASAIVSLEAITALPESRTPTGQTELDRVLGGGLVAGSVVLLGGDPGIGKSTLLLQMLCDLSAQYRTLYVTGEESLQQVKLRAQRLQVGAPLNLLSETQVERILALAHTHKPHILVIDSIQTMHTELLQSAPGSVAQVRESAAQLVRFAKQSGTALCLVGHVTKEGALAGPRVLEHMVDTVLYFEGMPDSRFRMIRAVKNRFGAVNELGIFAMSDKGLRGVNNPSAIFLSQFRNPTPGSVVMVTWEGSRPLLVEIQALVDESHLNQPRRLTVGLDQNRLALILAVLHRHGAIATYQHDVFVNAVGGVRVLETAADVAVASSVLLSLKNQALPRDWILFGEIGLTGEIRPVQSGQERLKEAFKQGYRTAIVPKANLVKGVVWEDPHQVIGVETLDELLQTISNHVV